MSNGWHIRSAAAMILAGMAAMSVTAEDVVYRIDRGFDPTDITISDAGVFNIISAATNLTGIIEAGSPIVTNSCSATEYEGVSWGQASITQAWNNVGNGFKVIGNYTNIFDDPGWIKGVESVAMNGDVSHGAFMWALANTLSFTTPGSTYYTNAGKIYLLEEVMVGTLGDYEPGTNYVETFPKMDDPAASNYPGCRFLKSEQPTDSETVKYSFRTEPYYRLIRPDIVLASDAAVNSPRHFEFGEEDLYHACTIDLVYTQGVPPLVDVEEQKVIDAALTIYYEDVRDATGGVQQFDITLTETPPLTNEVAWTLASGPSDSGILTNSTQPVATFMNPTKGGHYVFNVNIRDVDTKCQAWLPVAGPDISHYWSNEVARIKEWGISYRSNLNERANLPGPPFYSGMLDYAARRVMLARDFLSFGLHLDWNVPTNQAAFNLLYYAGDTPCGLADVMTLDSSMGDVARFTMYGRVTDAAKRNNMGFALVAKEMGFPDIAVLRGPDLFGLYERLRSGATDVGTPDSAAAIESYRAGIDLHNGVGLESVMKSRGLKMLEPGMRAAKEWPSHESTTGGLVLKEQAKTRMEELVDD